MKTLFYTGVLALSACLPLWAAKELPQLPKVAPWRKTVGTVKETTFKPVLNRSSIQFGNKTLQLSPNGLIECISREDGVLFSMNMYFHVKVNGKDDYGWRARSFDAANSKFTRNGNQYIWDLRYRGEDEKHIIKLKQILEVLKDGKLKFTAKYTMPGPSQTHTYLAHQLTYRLKDTVWIREMLQADGKPVELTRNLRLVSKGKNPEWTFGSTNPVKKFTVQIRPPEMRFFEIYYRKFNASFEVRFQTFKPSEDWTTLYLDFTKGVDPQTLGEVRGGVNFQKQENMNLPALHEKNMITNPSFECGFEGWNSSFHSPHYQWDWEPFAIDGSAAYDGKYSLRINARDREAPFSMPNLGPFQMAVPPGVYTFSFYAKSEQNNKSTLIVWGYDFLHSKWVRIKGCYKRISLTPEWKRYSLTFTVPENNPGLALQFCAVSEKNTQAGVWVDAVQLEKGGKMTGYQPHSAEGYLLTSSPDNFISSVQKIEGRLRITTSKPEAGGKVRVTVKNFFGEMLLDQTSDFKTKIDCTAELLLPLDSLPGLGVFIVKCEYKLSSGENYYDIHRYARIEFQNVPRPYKRMFSASYGGGNEENYRKKLDRWRKLGVGSRFHHGIKYDKLWKLEASYDVTPYISSIFSYMREKSRITHFCIIDTPHYSWNWQQDLKDPKILLRDFYLDSNGTITSEYQAKLKEAVKTIVKKNPHVRIWMLGGELNNKLPNEWWGKGFTDRDVARSIAMLLKPFVEGVKEANPKAKVFQDCPASMSPRGGIASTDLLLDECNKLGIKFDVICIHPYRYSPENPDTDADAQLFFSVLKKHGYDQTPVIWPEGMHWGPFDIPQWGIVSSTWHGTPPTWQGTISYDMGWTEKKSAAWYSRAWLVGLKYGDRVLGFTAGNTNNNSYMDYLLTPYAAQLIPNTLSCILGDAKFKKDIRVVPYLRTYVFEDAQKRPVAVIWNHHEDVDNAVMEAPRLTVNFGDSLETVLDLMNSPRKFARGKVTFQVSGFPLFFRGKPGTLNKIIAAFENAELSSGSSFSPLTASAIPVNDTQMKLTLTNSLSKEFKGMLNGQPIMIPSSGIREVNLPLPSPLQADRIQPESLKVNLKADGGARYSYDIAFSAFKVKRLPDTAKLDTVDWATLAAIPFPQDKEHKTSGEFRFGWNKLGFYIEVRVKDSTFVHVEYPQSVLRWKNDSVQLFIDTLANARDRHFTGFDEDDYAYGIFPNSKGNSARVFRYRSVESQLGLATQAPPDNSFADDIPCRFSNQNGMLTYRVFIPAKYLLPIKLQKGFAFGFALQVNNSDLPGKTNGKALSLASDGKGCYNRPHVWPVAVLSE